MKKEKKEFSSMVTAVCIMGIFLMVSMAIVDNANGYGIISKLKRQDTNKYYYEIAVRKRRYFFSSEKKYQIGDTIDLKNIK